MGIPAVGRYGVYGVYDYFSHANRAREVERLGYGAIWIGGSPPADLGWIENALSQTERIVVGAAVVNIWESPAAVVARSFHRLEGQFPGRLMLGLGAGNPEHNARYQTPRQALESYLDELEAAGVPLVRLFLAARRERMLRLSATRTAGAHQYLCTPEQTSQARGILGSASMLVAEQKVVLTEELAVAHALGRDRLAFYLELSNYVSSFRELGFPNLEIGSPAPDELVEALVYHGTAAQLAAQLSTHLTAGANHVAIQVTPVDRNPIPVLAELAQSLDL
ncbi:TIGR03620 family F420-dependent LLM class oxidoreductase [Mycobacteroides sp. CBMA 271]|uniref:TIGR03620 family F420-dependent LLM class oxidoreductase n=1 Tax=Mycobacteroides sp. CBMA 271 TaxID=2606608 RepID=UPI001FB6C2C6|nr:TIGR03620 family F420-dependent LLM class oxidoreductase [Mycobacteroides sp. CBMA 271]